MHNVQYMHLLGQTSEMEFSLSPKQANDLIILVENMGRVNYAMYPFRTFDSQRKGVINASIQLNDKEVQVVLALLYFFKVSLLVDGVFSNFEELSSNKYWSQQGLCSTSLQIMLTTTP